MKNFISSSQIDEDELKNSEFAHLGVGLPLDPNFDIQNSPFSKIGIHEPDNHSQIHP